jgi:hypothetical protein
MYVCSSCSCVDVSTAVWVVELVTYEHASLRHQLAAWRRTAQAILGSNLICRRCLFLMSTGPPARERQGLERAAAEAAVSALRSNPAGDVLVFLPGVAEIRRWFPVDAYVPVYC